MIKTALISVSDKKGIVDFTRILQEKNVKIISTGGTAKHLKNNGIKVEDVANITGFPELMNGRVKTLHPNVHGGLLALRNNKDHLKQIKENGIGLIDLIVVNLYPFKQTIEKENVKEAEAIEQIDIGGPSMLRSAAKNFESVTVVSDTNDLDVIGKEILKSGNTKLETRKYLAIKVFDITSKYDAQISNYLSKGKKISLFFEKIQELRYGENPHQKAIFLKSSSTGFNISNAKKLQGKELSYNNIMDADLAWQIVEEFNKPCCSIIKHATPCGVSIGKNAFESFINAYEVDKISPFGGIIALNKEVGEDLAKKLIEIFLEIVIAPSFTKEALKIFGKKRNLRILEIGGIKKELGKKIYKKVGGGLLIQDKNEGGELTSLKTVTTKKASKNNISDMQFGWKVIKYVKSNAILIAKNGKTIGIGAGQTNRVKSVKLALEQAIENKQDLKGAVLVSDAFFPFEDGIEAINNTGISSILQPGGSIKDKQVIKKANEIGVSMIFCGERAFLH